MAAKVVKGLLTWCRPWSAGVFPRLVWVQLLGDGYLVPEEAELARVGAGGWFMCDCPSLLVARGRRETRVRVPLCVLQGDAGVGRDVAGGDVAAQAAVMLM